MEAAHGGSGNSVVAPRQTALMILSRKQICSVLRELGPSILVIEVVGQSEKSSCRWFHWLPWEIRGAGIQGAWLLGSGVGS